LNRRHQARGRKKSTAPFVDGTVEINFVRSNPAFVFRNPNVTGECICGESFPDSAA
jgi:iron-sulfur cluster assembly protein